MAKALLVADERDEDVATADFEFVLGEILGGRWPLTRYSSLAALADAVRRWDE